jgi:hypothetical protein
MSHLIVLTSSYLLVDNRIFRELSGGCKPVGSHSTPTRERGEMVAAQEKFLNTVGFESENVQ